MKRKIIHFLGWAFVSVVALVVGSVVLFLVIGTLGMHPYIGLFPESHFRLAPDSRLPLWFALPAEHKRHDVHVDIYYYTPPFGKTNFVAYLVGPGPESKRLGKKYGVSRWHPGSEKRWYAKYDRFPDFNIVTVAGVTELIEHRHMAPIFHISDDPEMKRSMMEKNRP